VDILALELSIEQQFSLAKYAKQVKELSPDRAQEFLVEAFRQLMVKDNVIRALAKTGSLN
jgi:Phycobilisome degradation protein nblA